MTDAQYNARRVTRYFWFVMALAAGGLIGQHLSAEPVRIGQSLSTVEVLPPSIEGAWRDVEFHNTMTNQNGQNGTYDIGEGVTVEYVYGGSYPADYVVITPPDGFECYPSCTLEVEEEDKGRVHLFSVVNVGV